LFESPAGDLGLFLVIADEEPNEDVRIDRDHGSRLLMRVATAAFFSSMLLRG